MERVLVIGATGNIGVAAILGALKTKRSVLAIVRNQNSAEKLVKNVGSKDGITTVEADVTSEHGVQGVVDQVKAGKLPAFQHVYACVGRMAQPPMHEMSTSAYRDIMSTVVDSHFFAYRATVPYLLEQNAPNSTWTVCTGAAMEYGAMGVVAMTQGALYAMTNAADRENQKTNIRVNEAFLNMRVEYDYDAEKKGVVKASEYGRIYEQILERKDIDGCRVSVMSRADLDKLNVKKKSEWMKQYQ